MTNLHRQLNSGLDRRRHERGPQADHSERAYLWCVVCEHAFHRQRFRGDGGQVRCPGPQCEGGLLFEPWEWSRVRQANPDYPEAPLPDAAYPFFGRPADGDAMH